MIRTFLMLVILTACSAADSSFQSEEEFIPGTFLADDLSFYELKEKQKIKLGMSREEVEARIGKTIDIIDFMGIFEYPGLKVHFDKDNFVNALIIDDNTENNTKFVTPRGVKYGDPIESIQQKYGDTANRDETGDTATFKENRILCQ